jgi:iron-sulfur cluster repair protein YtfE (RIC family)
MQRSGFLQGLGIDTCCGGQKTLAQTCAKLGLDPEDVLKQLMAVDKESPNKKKTPDL